MKICLTKSYHPEKINDSPYIHYLQENSTTLDVFIRQCFDDKNNDEILFSWFDCDNIVDNLAFFSRVLALQKKYQSVHQSVFNDIYISTLRVDAPLSDLLNDNNFLVWLTVIGPQKIYAKSGAEECYQRMINAVDALQRHQVLFGSQVEVNHVSAFYGAEIYQYLTRNIGVCAINYVPLLPVHASVSDGNWLPVHSGEWSEFLISSFYEWVSNGLGHVQVNIFDAAMAKSMVSGPDNFQTDAFCTTLPGNIGDCHHLRHGYDSFILQVKPELERLHRMMN